MRLKPRNSFFVVVRAHEFSMTSWRVFAIGVSDVQPEEATEAATNAALKAADPQRRRKAFANVILFYPCLAGCAAGVFLSSTARRSPFAVAAADASACSAVTLRYISA